MRSAFAIKARPKLGIYMYFVENFEPHLFLNSRRSKTDQNSFNKAFVNTSIKAVFRRSIYFRTIDPDGLELGLAWPG